MGCLSRTVGDFFPRLHLEARRVRKLDDRVHEGPVLDVTLDVAHEGAIDRFRDGPGRSSARDS